MLPNPNLRPGSDPCNQICDPGVVHVTKYDIPREREREREWEWGRQPTGQYTDC
jgi:hypothetical protein